VPHLLRLIGQGFDEVWMGMAERIDCDASAEIEISLTIAVDQPHAFASLESEVLPREGGKKRRRLGARSNHGLILSEMSCTGLKNQKAAPRGRLFDEAAL
jgi:hypothetical protein